MIAFCSACPSGIACAALSNRFRNTWPSRDASEGCRHLRVKPATRPRGHGELRRFVAVGDLENIDDLREKGDAGVDWNGIAAQVQRLPASVPMLVEVLNAERDRLGEAHLTGDIRAAMAARLDQLACHRIRGHAQGMAQQIERAAH